MRKETVTGGRSGEVGIAKTAGAQFVPRDTDTRHRAAEFHVCSTGF